MTEGETFEAFIKNKSREKGNTIDERKQYWVKSIGSLYSKIKNTWLKPYSKEIKISEEVFTISEPFLGRYELKSLLIALGKERVIIKPNGIEVIGAYGRVDIIGKNQIIYLLLDSKGKWHYKMKTPFIEFKELNKQSFLEILTALMND